MECEHGSDPASCPVCLGPAPEPPSEPPSRPFPAKFQGHCRECNLPIYPGQAIRIVDDIGIDRAVHDGCEP